MKDPSPQEFAARLRVMAAVGGTVQLQMDADSLRAWAKIADRVGRVPPVWILPIERTSFGMFDRLCLFGLFSLWFWVVCLDVARAFHGVAQ